ncbi:restriction endonuclease [Pseudodonghicola flavimaris]|uniref:Restriction endonuclease n=1 Tax=Pseudodonghicola flavimaris TaxID=3050036 RepID=A0ABT7EZQ6_9RHOB|nr:restriction endonuclease [Pseudodonghicola flavimaris]MDK3017735.1 restriction endonuclease [Pseudodonghicola flavimaris]
MSIPTFQNLMLPVLRLIADGHETIPSCLAPLAEQFELTPDEVNELLPSGKQTVLANRAHWARNYMSQAGLVEPIKRGSYRLTPQGEATLRADLEQIDVDYLSRFPSFQEFRNRSNSDAAAERKPHSPALPGQDPADTPQEQIERAIHAHNRALNSDVIEAVLSLSPARFERLVVDLLLAMGYGGGDLERGLQTSLSNDGGIDGVINEDTLGLDAVYVQAKRYAPDNKVGRPALNAFVGSLTGEGASKGVFVTTSDFSKDAIAYVSRVQQRIVLINGQRLAQLLIEHEVGVRARKTYILRSVDEDYFSES